MRSGILSKDEDGIGKAGQAVIDDIKEAAAAEAVWVDPLRFDLLAADGAFKKPKASTSKEVKTDG